VKIDRIDNEGIAAAAMLSPDFAHRVVERLRKAKRRRRVARGTLVGAAVCALAGFVILSFRTRGVTPMRAPAAIARLNPDFPVGVISAPVGIDRSANPGATVVSDPVEFFFPGATAETDSQLSETTYWHSYDPWWMPNR
jgi:hypothetical protein